MHTASLREVFAPNVRPMLAVGVVLAIFQQITGINTVIYYAVIVLKDNAGLGDRGSLLANVVNGAVNVIMTIIAIRLLDRVGRRVLLLAGTVGMAVGMFMTAFSFIGGSMLTLVNAIGPLGVFLLFGCMTLVALSYFYAKVPETKGRSLQQLEQDLTGRAVG
jgi:MFS family permease